MTNSYAGVPQRIGITLAAQLLAVGLPMLVATKFGMQDSQPDKSGLVRKWTRYESFPLTTAPAPEGYAPPGIPLRNTIVTATLQQYVGIVEITDLLWENHEDPVDKVAMKRLTEWWAQVNEVITISVLKSGTSVMYAGGAAAISRATVQGTVELNHVRKIKRAFNRARAMPISDVINASVRINTTPVEKGFYAMGHTDLEADIRNVRDSNDDKVFVTSVRYGSPDTAIPSEIGAIEGVRFCLTDLFSPWAASGATTTTFLSNGDNPGDTAAACDVYPLIFVAKDAYGVVKMSNRKSVDIAVLPPKPAPGDRAGQMGSVSVKWLYAAVILNQSWLYRLEVACSALA